MQALKQVREIPAVIKRVESNSSVVEILLRTAAYARVSTDHQETSYEAQIDFYTNYIKANPKWKFTKMYSDEDRTGTQMKNRKGFLSLIEDAKAGKIDLIVTKSISRFARNVVQCISTVRMLKDEYGVAVYFEKEGLMSTDPTAQLTLSIMASVAEEESRSISTNVRWRMLKKFEKGEPAVGCGLYGYTIKNAKDYIVNPAEALVVKRIFNEFLAGKTTRRIADGLMADGIIRIGRIKGDKKLPDRDKWNSSMVSYMLKNERYCGDAICQKSYKLDVLSKVKKNQNDGEAKMYYVESNHAGIINRETFMAVQAEITKRLSKDSTDKYASKYAFSRKIICGECGAYYRRAWHTKLRKGEASKTYIWHCKNKAEGNGCKSPTYKESEIQDVFVMLMAEVIDDKDRLIAETMAAVEQVIKVAGDLDATALESELLEKQSLMVELSKTKNSVAIAGLMNEIDGLNSKLDICRQADTGITAVKYRITEVQQLFKNTKTLTQFDTTIFKSIVEECKIIGRNLQVRFKCGIELTQDF